MFNFVSKKLVQNSVRALESNHFHIPRAKPSLKFNSFSAISTTSSVINQHDSIKSAPVPTLLRDYGLPETHISNLVKNSPDLLSITSETTLKPKFDFFNSVGISPSDLSKILFSDPTILKRDLKKRFIPSFEFLKNVLHSNDDVIAAIKRATWIVKLDLEEQMAPNIAVLREHGVPDEPFISFLVKSCPNVLVKKPDRFKKIVEEVKEMGFNASKWNFVDAVKVLISTSNLAWEQKSEVYRRWGWSEDDIQSAFKKAPLCMTFSDKKIEQVMDFLVNKMGWPASEVVEVPGVIDSSLEKWIMPRCLVVQLLLTKGLIKEKISLRSFVTCGEKQFVKKFVTNHCAKVPELLRLYQRKAEDLQLKG